jgi:short-subunit dehydrogenase
MSAERDTRAPARRHPETALVTGASSGIGLEIARELAADGHTLALVARDRARLTALADELRSQHGIQAGAAENLWAALSEAGLTVDVLVNNAGVGLYGELQDLSLDALTAMQMINVVSLTTLTRLALPAMLARRHGRILNVASVVGYQPGGPRWAAYYGTKSYVLSFSKGLARELAGSGVSVTVLSPGLTRSAFEGKTGASETNLYRWVPQATAKSVAKAGYRAMMSGRRAVIPGLGTKLLAFAGELPPRAIALEVNHWLLSRRSAEKDGVTAA